MKNLGLLFSCCTLVSPLAGQTHPGIQHKIGDQCGEWEVTQEGVWQCNDGAADGQSSNGGACSNYCVSTCPFWYMMPAYSGRCGGGYSSCTTNSSLRTYGCAYNSSPWPYVPYKESHVIPGSY